MLRRYTSPLIRLARRTTRRFNSTSPSPPPPPRGSYFSASTIYPFLLLSAITSLALNLSHQRTARSQETSTLLAQISVLESILTKLRNPSSGALDSEEIERELELVGLGRGKGKKGLGEGELGERKERVSWREVLLGTKDERYREEEDNTDWEKGMSLIVTSLSSEIGADEIVTTSGMQSFEKQMKHRNHLSLSLLKQTLSRHQSLSPLLRYQLLPRILHRQHRVSKLEERQGKRRIRPLFICRRHRTLAYSRVVRNNIAHRASLRERAI